MKLTFTNNTLPIGEIKITKEFSRTIPRLEKLKKCMDFYRTNGYFDRQIIVDSDKTLHDGYCAYLTAYLLGVKTVRVMMVGEQSELIKAIPPAEPEPVKLYCVKGYRGNLTRGKIYEVKDGFMRYDDGSKAFVRWMDIAEDIKESWLFKGGYLVPLARRPAKVGEWVLVTDSTVDRFMGTVGKVERINSDGNPSVRHKTVWFDTHGDGTENTSMDGCNYLVLDGYHGDPA